MGGVGEESGNLADESGEVKDVARDGGNEEGDVSGEDFS